MADGCPGVTALQKGKCRDHIKQKGNGTNRSWNRIGKHCLLVGRKALETAWGEDMSSATSIEVLKLIS